MSEQSLQQEDFTVEMVGVVTDPPDLEIVKERIRAAADAKEPIWLSPGEARVLINDIDAA